MKIIALMTCSLLLIILAGCSAPAGIPERTFTDDAGTTVNIPDRVERVVSLAPSETELCCAAGGCDLLVGRTDYCTNPPGIEQVETVGGPRTFAVEKVIGLAPDLVLATTVSDPVRIQELRSAGLTVVVFRLENIDDIYRNIESLGILLSVPDSAAELVENLTARQREIEQRSPGNERVKVLYVLWDEPLYVAGANTFQNDLITRAGGINIMEDTEGYVTISDEAVVNRAPEVIIVSREHTAGRTRIADRLLSRQSLADVPAVKEHRICEMEADLVNRPGPRVITALEMFSRCINA
ncbi:MAG: ABC transporter substrate-binding protein [Methanomicrobiales archaeon]|nr:ABC transporter substrate-binding protein [Methanomicrobiales archaeon]NYT20580.1 ABC transporter substrate-binding protein [Methanomicrobiales archaeon]